MARELGLTPKKLGGMANHDQERWKVPLPQYIEQLYEKRFKKKQPDDVRPLEVREAEMRRKKADRKAAKLKAQEHGSEWGTTNELP